MSEVVVSTPRGSSKSRAGAVNLQNLPERPVLSLTLRELAALYLAHHPDRADPLTVMRKWCDDFNLGDRDAWTITKEMLAAGCAAMYAANPPYAISTVNHNLSVIGSLYKWADAREHTPAGFVSPTRHMHRKKDEVRIVEPARPGEWEHMRALARGITKDPRFQMMVWLVMDTGARRSEVTDRTWLEFQIDCPKPHIVLPPALSKKNGVGRKLYFSHETAALVRRLRPVERFRDLRAFAGTRGTMPNRFDPQWRRLCTMVGRPGLHVHDLRHMIAAHFVDQGHGLPEVANLLGHTSTILWTRYAHLDDKNTQKLQTERLGLDAYAAPAELPAVVEARARQAERDAAAPSETEREIARLMLIAQDAMAAVAAAQAAIAASRGAA